MNTIVEDALKKESGALEAQIEGIIRAIYDRYGLSTKVYDPTTLSTDTLDTCFDLVRSNVSNLYESSSWGWNPVAKRKEMTEAATRYIVVSRGSDIVAFLSFQMLLEDDTPVSYLYEVHTSTTWRSKGLGSLLLSALQTLSLANGINKVMLTVFTANKRAVSLYKDKFGFEVDESSPKPRRIRTAVHQADYVILSRSWRK